MDLKCDTLLDSLNEDCLLSIFKLLKFEDLMNIAETCNKFKSIADQLFKKKYSKFALHRHGHNLFNEGRQGPERLSINRILRHIGHHVTSLEIQCNDVFPCNRLFDWIECKKLKQLIIRDFNGACENVLSTHRFDSLEIMTSYACNLANLKSIVKDLNQLKCLNVCNSYIERDDLQMILGNNPNIESFTYVEGGVDFNFDCQLLQLIPKVKKLALICRKDSIDNILNLSLLCNLEFLTSLRIDQSEEIEDVLGKFANKSLLKELELHEIFFDDSFVNVLKDFDKLEVLHVHGPLDYDDFPTFLQNAATVWPANIKQLFLYNMSVTREVGISIIRQLKFLERFDASCEFGTESADVIFRNIFKLVANRPQKLYLALSWGPPYGWKNRPSIDSDRLKVFQEEDFKCNSMNIRLKFTGTSVWMLHCGCFYYMNMASLSDFEKFKWIE